MIIFYTGSMFAGKTTALIMDANNERRKGQRVGMFKPCFDTRYGTGVIKTHDNVFVDAYNVNNVEEIKWIEDQFDVFCFDEIQFFPEEVVEIIKDLSAKGKKVIISGLDLDFKREWFKVSLAVYGLADVKYTKKAKCHFCGESAGFTLRLSASNSLFELGASDKYVATCIDCHQKHFKG